MVGEELVGDRVVAENRRAAELFRRVLAGDLEGLDEAIRLWDRVRRAVPEADKRHAAVVVSYCTGLIYRFEMRGGEGDLRIAVQLLRAQGQEAGHGHPYRPTVFAALGWALQRDAELTGSTATMDEAVRARKRALTAVGRRSSDYDQHLSDLGGTVAARGTLAGSLPDLREAVRIHQAVVRRTPTGHPQRAGRLSLLGVARIGAFELAGDRADLDAGLQAHRAALEAARPGDSVGMLHSNVGNALGLRYDYVGGPEVLEESVVRLRSSVQFAPPGRFERPRRLIGLATALKRRFEATGSLEDLNSAIDAFRQALGTAEPGDEQYARALCGLGGVLLLRSTRIGDSDSLQEALYRLADGVKATPADHPNRPDRLSTLAAARMAAFSTRPAMYPQIIAPLQEAIVLAPPGHVRRAMYLASLGKVRSDEYELTGDRTVLAEALSLQRAAVEQTPPGHVERVKRLANWGITLIGQAGLDGGRAPAEEAVTVCQAAVDAMDTADPGRAQALLALARALALREDTSGSIRDLQPVLEALREAAGHPAAPTQFRIQAACELGHRAARAGDCAAGLEGLAAAVGLLGEAAWRGLDREAQVQILGQSAGLPEDAAALALQEGRPQYAVELLEQGRGVLLAHTLDDRTSYDRVHERAPELAEQLADVITALAATPQPLPVLLDRSYAAAERRSPMDQRTELAARRDELVERIRRIDGLEDFLHPPRFADLQSAGDRGPVVIVNVSDYRCDAIAITPTSLTTVPLPDMTLDETIRWGRELGRAVAIKPGTQGRSAAEAKIQEILGEIWDMVTSPVLEALNLPRGAGTDAPRVWWCPTGAAAALPLHAAGHHQTAGGETALDRITSSYTPTLRALQHLRCQGSAPVLRRPVPLVVAMPSTPGQPPLPGAQAEVDYLAARFPDGRILSGTSATLETVIAAMPAHAWVHFSCHGQRDAHTGSGDRLLLHDGLLTASHIAHMDTGDAALAFLSACDTYTTGDAVPDECLTIGSALQLAGYRHVIATQWPVYDSSTADLSADVYSEILTGPHCDLLDAACAAHALRASALHARCKFPQEPTRWAPYIHLGPD
ncbi:CHAT domain-containing protein [Streptomyces fuscichromogenes]|uniref:CHAT domain-containing protein n=1 Tax=Streptomyces fuscichromogenes TaxID=1324013 RepID=UPI003800AE70